MAKVTLEGLMQFMLEHMATKEDVAEIRKEMATKEDVAEIRKEMATKEDLAQIRTEMVTKDELDHQTGVLERKIERSEINFQTALYKQSLELKSYMKHKIDELANSAGAQTRATEQRLTALERREAGSG